MDDTWLIAGLGNPGKRYENTRHNIGFKVLDQLHSDWGGQNWSEKNGGAYSEFRRPGIGRIILIKPLEFMNRSGGAVSRLAAFFKVDTQKIIALHDDVDLYFGSLRIKVGGGDGGHNGIKSLVQCLGSADFIRIRVGVGRPDVETVGRQSQTEEPGLAGWVLGAFSPDEQKELSALVKRGVTACELILSEGVLRAQNAFN